MIIPLFISYAEIHYHLKILYPKYFNRFPETIFDIPKRIIADDSNKIPLLIIFKDADKFPIRIHSLKFTIWNEKKKIVINSDYTKEIDKNYHSDIVEIQLDKSFLDTYVKAQIEFTLKNNKKEKHCINDSYDGFVKEPFTFFYSSKKLPFPKDWYAGDPHYHSNYTNDQVEFGADVKSTAFMAKKMGLKWFFAADHSYDLDDFKNDYLHNDPKLQKWEEFKEECNSLNNIKELPLQKRNNSFRTFYGEELPLQKRNNSFKTIFGEEVSIGNAKKENVHLLLINEENFIEGKGDGAELWFRNKPDNLLRNIHSVKKSTNLLIAAHPNEQVPFLQKLTLNRGKWNLIDFQQAKIRHLQLINKDEQSNIYRNINYWKSLLLEGHKFVIVAGNDAHGNFNFMKQISIPFRKLFSNKTQIFGNLFTAFKYKNNDPIMGLKNSCVIISNGPFLEFTLKRGKKTYQIGDSIGIGKYQINISAKSSKEFGKIKSVKLYQGFPDKNSEILLDLKDGDSKYFGEKSYLRMSLKTENGFAYTNPIWVNY